MKTKMPQLGLLLALTLITLFLIQACQKEEQFGLNNRGINPASTLEESIRLFNNQTAQPQYPQSGSLRQKAQKIPLWQQAQKVQLSIGQAYKVPLSYPQPLYLLIGPQKEPVSLSELSYLLVYTNPRGIQQYEVVTQIPDADYWTHRQQPNHSFSGTIIIEDWWGRPLKTFRKTVGQHYIPLGSPTLELHPTPKGHQQKAAKANCDVVVSTDGNGMYNVELTCPPEGADNGGGGWGGFGGYGGGFGGGGSGSSPNPPDYEGHPHGGGGGGSHHSPPPPPDRPEINTPEEFLAEIDDSQLTPCFKAVLRDIKNLSQGSVAGIIQKFAGNVPLYDWELKNGNLLSNENASTNPIYNKITGRVYTIFDSNKFNNASDLAIARTIMHEAVHAYLVTYFATNQAGFIGDYPQMVDEWEIYFNWNDVHHEEFARTIINQIAKSLKEYADTNGYSIPNPTYFDDMAWGGLTGTTTFNSLPTNQQLRIKNLLSSEQTGYNLNNEYIGINGKTTGCNLNIE